MRSTACFIVKQHCVFQGPAWYRPALVWNLSAKSVAGMSIRKNTQKTPSVIVSHSVAQVRPCDKSNKTVPVLIDFCLMWLNVRLLSTILSDRNFLFPDHKSDKRTICMCKHGFHCSSEECITCVPHTTCKPGHEVQSKGTTHLSDALNPLFQH